MKSICLTILAALALLGAGCLSDDIRQAYPGAPLSADETCMLRVPAMLDVQAIDGVPTDWSMRVKRGRMQDLSLLPGNHRLLIRYYDATADESKHEVYEADRLEVVLMANPRSVHELKYETWARNPEMRRAKEKVRVWLEQVSSGVPTSPRPAAAAGRAPSAASVAPSEPSAGAAAAGNRVETLKNSWNTLAPAERETFLKWLLAQP